MTFLALYCTGCCCPEIICELDSISKRKLPMNSKCYTKLKLLEITPLHLVQAEAVFEQKKAAFSDSLLVLMPAKLIGGAVI